MKKEDFIVGKWYVSSLWTSFIATKFSGFNKQGYFSYSESIQCVKGRHMFSLSVTTSDRQDWSTFREVDPSEIEEYLPKGHPDLKLNIIDSNFPEAGCYFDDEDIVLNHLKSIGYIGYNEGVTSKRSGYQHIRWNKKNEYFYLTSSSSNVKNYTTQQINQLLNINKNEVLKTKTENTRPIIKGAIGLRSRGQQITDGSRHQGNSASIITCKTKSVSIEISKNIVKRSNS